MNRKQLKILLKEHGVPFHIWGKGEAKTFEDLFEEQRTEETIFQIFDGNLLRCIAPAVIDVYYPLPRSTTIHHLHEVKQVYVDGRIRIVSRDTSVSEKMIPRETPEQAARRGLQEELGFKKNDRYTIVQVKQDCLITGGTRSFPGLPTFRRRYFFTCLISKDLYDADGYEEIQPGKKIVYFEWEPERRGLAQPYTNAILSGLTRP